MSDLPFQGALKLRSINMQIPNTETLTEITGPPTGENETYPENLTRENLTPEMTVDKDSQPSPLYERGTLIKRIMTRSLYKENSQDDEVTAYFTNMSKLNDITYSEYLHIAHDIKEMNTTEDKVKDLGFFLSDFLPEPK